jgi:hypothetical protein
VVTVLQKLLEKHTRRPGIMGDERSFRRLAHIKFNPEVGGDLPQGSQRIHTVPNYLHA